MENFLTESVLQHRCICVGVILLAEEDDDTRVAEEAKVSSFLNLIWFLKNSDGVFESISGLPKIDLVYFCIETHVNVCEIIKSKIK